MTGNDDTEPDNLHEAPLAPEVDIPPLTTDGIDLTELDQVFAIVNQMVKADEPDPLPVYRELREVHGDFIPGFGDTFADRTQIARNFAMPERPSLMAVSDRAVRECLRDQARFSGKLYDDMGNESGGSGLPLLEGPPHLRLRKLLGQGLNPRSVKVWEDRMIRPVVKRLLAGAPFGTPVDFERSFCQPLPAMAVGAVLGFPGRDLQAFNLLAFLQFVAPINAEGKKAEQRLTRYFFDHVRARRELGDAALEPYEDVISRLVRARIGNDKLSDTEIVPNLHFLLFAGSDTTYKTLCNIVAYLVDEPGLLDRVARDRSRVADLIEETLRLNPPGPVIGRLAKIDTEVCGVTIKAGTPIAINLLMANRDPAVWDDPDRFDLDRSRESMHVTFGTGAHMCPGMHLARLEMTVAINELLDRAARIDWDDRFGRPSIKGIGVRSVEHVRVVLTQKAVP